MGGSKTRTLLAIAKMAKGEVASLSNNQPAQYAPHTRAIGAYIDSLIAVLTDGTE